MQFSYIFQSRSVGLIHILAATICLLWFSVLAVRATDYYVATNGAGGDFLSWGTAASNIQDAVNVACGSVDHTVWVSNGTYRLTNQVAVTNRITVRGLNGYSNTLVYADWPTWTTRCFYVTRTGMVDGFTISNGHNMVSNDYNGGGGAYVATGTIQNCYFVKNVCSNGGIRAGGGGILIWGSGTVSNCIFITNIAYLAGGNVEDLRGGAIMSYLKGGGNGYILGCVVVSNWSGARGGGIELTEGNNLISNCTVSMNYSAEIGGGIHSQDGGPTITDCVVSNNNGYYAAIYVGAGMIKNCVVVNNTVRSSGGAVVPGGSTTVSNCNISGNNGGGGIRMSGATVVNCVISNNLNTINGGWQGGGVGIKDSGILRNCLIHHNTNTASAKNGGGLYLTNSALDRAASVVINCTIVNNYSTNEGGGIAANGPSNYIVNCVIASNSSSSGNYPNVYHHDNVDANKSNFYYCCAVTTDAYLFAANQGNITNDPTFASAGNWRLGGNSPCINRGTNQNWMANAIDLDSKTRIRYGTVDMGAYERIHEATIYNFQ